MKTQTVAKWITRTCLLLLALSAAQAQIHVDSARIGCLDIQKDPNLTGLVGNACNGKNSCSYKAPTEAQYRSAGVQAKTRTFCTQGMEIIYHCGNVALPQKIEVQGDAWNYPAANLECAASASNLGSQPNRLRGFVDLHTHPLSNVGFGGKFVYGGVDAGSLMPAVGCNHRVSARNEQDALGNDNGTHGGPGLDNVCGDLIRKSVISAFESNNHGAAQDEKDGGSGYPDFPLWPAWNDLTHQKMWVEWIRRAYYGGLRVMVALAVNNKTLGDMTAGPGDYPTDDKSSADLQIAGIKSFVARHPDFMEVAYNSSDVYRIVSANKLAVVIGVEIDHIGNIGVAKGSPIPYTPAPPPDSEVKAEIDRLYNEGVRYIFPIHLLDNSSGGAAAYQSIFDASNWRESGHPYDLVCADPKDDIKDHDQGFTFDNGALQDLLQIAGEMAKLGWAPLSISSPQCPAGIGQKNRLGLFPSGVFAIKEMMRHGMLIDIDHMSQASADGALALGTQFGYPLNSGHNGVRGVFSGGHNERSFRADQYATIGRLHGMAGVGSAQLDAQQWLMLYNAVIHAMGSGAVAGFGTDTDGLEFAMRPRLGIPPREVQGPQYKKYQDCLREEGEPAADRAHSGSGSPRTTGLAANAARVAAICRKQFPQAFSTLPGVPGSSVQYTSSFPASRDGNKTWNYNSDGVAHYGMLWDFLQDVRTLPGGAAVVDQNLMNGADYFAATWRIAETKSRSVQ